MDNLGLTQSNTYGRLVQIIDGRYYDGFGNRLYIGASVGTSGDGSSGINGANGSSGSSGSSGQDGFTGSSGSSGEDGSSGITPNVEPLTEVSISPPPDDINRVFTLSVPLTVGSQHMFFISGQLLSYGDDYIISGTTLTIDDERPAPETLDVLRLFGSVGTVLIAGSSGSSGANGILSGTSGSSGSGLSGTSGSSGSGLSGTSGSSGSGFNTITNTLDNRILTSLGTTNTANAEANLTFDGSKLSLTGTTGSTGSTIFTVNGNSGQLFSVTDSLIGDIFSVSDISGIPILTVNSNEIVTIDGSLYMNSGYVTGLTSSSTILSIPISNGNAAFFDYYVTNTISGSSRSGTISSIWNQTQISYSDLSTPDLVSPTDGIEFILNISGINVLLNATITTGTWKVKVGTRVI
jgi:hypothetical protein